MKDRLEDLGRIRQLVDDLVQHPVFEEIDNSPKWYEDKFFAMTREQQGDKIHELAYGIDYISSKLSEIFIIARGDKEGWED